MTGPATRVPLYVRRPFLAGVIRQIPLVLVLAHSLILGPIDLWADSKAAEPKATLFLLLAIWLALRADSWKAQALSAAMMLLAALIKEPYAASWIAVLAVAVSRHVERAGLPPVVGLRSAWRPLTTNAPSSARSTRKPAGTGRWIVKPSGSGSALRASTTSAARRPVSSRSPVPVTAETTRSAANIRRGSRPPNIGPPTGNRGPAGGAPRRLRREAALPRCENDD